MTDASRPTGYSVLQIALHWLVAFLIVAAYFASDDMGRALRDRVESGASGVEGNTLHVWLGGAAFAIILIRLAVRLIQGAPKPMSDDNPVLAAAAIWGHRLLYAVMIATPALGAAAWYGGILGAGEVHELFGNALLLLAAGHVLAAMLHEALRGDGTMARMVRPRR